MIWLVLSAIVAIVLYIVVCVKCGAPEDAGGWIASCMIFAACAVLLWFILMVTSHIVAVCAAETQWKLVETREIYALNDNVGVSGRFYLGSGHVEDEMKYYFVEKTEKGKVVNSIGAKNAYIVESNAETPRIEKLEKRWTNNIVFWFTCSLGPNISEYKIYIPENSVTTDFNVDLGSGSIVPQNPATTAPSTVINHCANCGHALGAADKFCAACGTSIVEPTPTCPNCNTSCETPYCPACGTKVK